MPKQEENFAPESVWHTLTPNAAALSMPFCITEAGHFYAMESYLVERRRHESHLLLYTVSGSGRLITQDAELTLTPGSCAVIDCRSYHKYNTQLAPWNFYWVHFQGVAASAMLSVLYPARITAIAVQDTQGFTQLLEGILAQESSGTVADSMELSAQIHGLFNLLAAPCIGAVSAMRKELGSWKWTLAAVGFQTGTAYLVAMLVYQTGLALFYGGSLLFTAAIWGLTGLILWQLTCLQGKNQPRKKSRTAA